MVIWIALAPEKLSARTRKAIELEHPRYGMTVSDKTLWELAMSISRDRVTVHMSLGDFLQAVEENFTVLPITSAIAEPAVSFSDRYPRDPMDRLVGATAIVHGMKLITSDGLIRASNEVDCIWQGRV